MPLHQRLRSGAGAQRCPARHCWVAGGADGHGVPRPGLLLEWRRSPAGWEGRVAYVAQLRPETWVLIEEWLPGEQLVPLPAGSAGGGHSVRKWS